MIVVAFFLRKCQDSSVYTNSPSGIVPQHTRPPVCRKSYQGGVWCCTATTNNWKGNTTESTV